MGKKKVKASGRFGVRYGLRSRRAVDKVEERQRRKYECKRCGKRTIKRTGTGIWSCNSCGYKFAGGTYVPRTPAMKIVEQSIRRSKSSKS